MIASLHGQIQAIRGEAIGNSVIVEVGGVGYLVHVTSTWLNSVGRAGQYVELYTHLYVRENELALYGFPALEDLDLFRMLIAVSGIGPRTAMSVLSTFSPETLRGAIAQGDAAALMHVPGIGRKTAQRLLLDLKDRVSAGVSFAADSSLSLNAADADTLNALTALGYSIAEAQHALASVPSEVQELDQRILHALRHLGSR